MGASDKIIYLKYAVKYIYFICLYMHLKYNLKNPFG
jgi:hypothetical protein